MGTDTYAALSRRRRPRIQKHIQTLSGDLGALGRHTPTRPSRRCFRFIPEHSYREFTGLEGAPRTRRPFA